MSKVTIGMPVYNGTNFIAAAIDSILAQSFGDFHLLISDNASTWSTTLGCLALNPPQSRPRAARKSGSEFAERLKREGRTANLLIANNVVAHVADPNDFVAGIRTVFRGDN
jgi:hypothetical protein